ncbi:MAG: folate family ECF transporter S component [Selenomonas sp.]|uniref:folate family ECF transporter S component n=1 Tax=Selenomonas sp. TaxID=2053611 RepID=UPI0025DAFBB1|nr:folate family ECF transporter S component [Selenomonas sp.]MCR5439519.1 folate family ECF transporter S component [Selenomonas sp.]
MSQDKVRAMVYGAFSISFIILLTYVFSIQMVFIHITFGFLPLAMYGAWFGPWRAGVIGSLANFLGTAVLGFGVFFPGFMLSDFLTGWIYGFFFHNKLSVGWKNAWLPFLLVTVIVHLGLNTLWLVLFYDKAASAIFMGRLVKNILCYPLEIGLFLLVYRPAAAWRLQKS